MCHKSRTPLVHHFTPFSFTISKPGATDPLCQTPGLGSCFLVNVIGPQVNLRQRFVDFQRFGKGLWTTRMANHVKPENLQGNLPQYIAMSTTTHWSLDHEVKIKRWKKLTLLHICKIFCENTLHLLGWNFSLALQVSELSPPSHLHLPSHFRDSWKDPVAQHLSTCPTPLMSQKSPTPLVHHFTPFSFTVSRPGATDPRAKHQALAPSSPILLALK